MAMKPTVWQEQGLVTSPGEFQGEENATANSPLQDREAPRVTPEEDIDVQEPGAEGRAPHETQTSGITVDVTQKENQKSTDINQSTPRETQEMVTELEDDPQKLPEASPAEDKLNTDLCEEVFPPPPTSDVQSSGEHCEKEGLYSLEGEVAEWISDAEVISDFTHLDQQSSEEWARMTQFIELVNQDKISDSVDDICTENDTFQLVQQSPFDIYNSDDANSPPYVDESEEEEGADGSCEVFQPSHCAVTKPDSALCAAHSAGQREELLLHSPCELTPRGVNQEAAQQVFGQGSPPLSTVVMELTNQGREGSQGCGCVAAVRERCSRVGEKTEKENELTGGEEGQKDSELGKNKPTEESGSTGLVNYQKPVQNQEVKTGKQNCGVSPKESRGTRMRNNLYDDSRSNSGGSADISPCRTLEGTTITTDDPATETPIEREIRRAIQREQSLRRSRGLPNPHTSPEYVEIPFRKSFLSQSSTAKWSQNKDREFAGKKMQHEIHEETQREQDLVKIGKIPGFYDKGTVRQIKERKQLFEAFQMSLEPIKSKTPSLCSESTEELSLESLEDVKSQASILRNSPVERKPMLLNPNQAKGGADNFNLQGTDVSDGTGCQIIILENRPTILAQKQKRVKPEADIKSENPYNSLYQARIEETEKEEEEASGENPFFKLRSSTNLVKQDILEAKERERELRKMRVSLYGGINGTASSSQKELSPPDVPESSSKKGRGSSAAQQPGSKLSAWPPVQAEQDKITRPEVLQNPQTPRQKTPLVQLWESGLVNGYNLEDD